MHSQRRHCSRYTVQPPGHVLLGSGHEAIILNTGEGGIGILASCAVKCDSDVEPQITLGLNAGTVKTQGKVAWANDTGEAGIHLLQRQEWQEYFQRWRSLGELRACWLRDLAALEAERNRGVRARYLATIALSGLICLSTAWAIRAKSRHFASVNTPARVGSESPQPTVYPTLAIASPMVSAPLPARAASMSADAPLTAVASAGTKRRVLPGISYESGPDFARFFFEVREHLKVHAVALNNPDRIYFDVPKTELKAGLGRKSVDLRNDFVRRVRISPKGGGVIRVVLDLNCSCPYRFGPSSDSPRGVTIEVRPHTAETAHAREAAPLP